MSRIPAGSEQMRAHRRVAARRAARVAKKELREETGVLVLRIRQFLCRNVIPDSEKWLLVSQTDRVDDLLRNTEE